MGDSDSARSILEEIMKDGNEDQKRQAGELLNQL
ncbi:MAG: FimV/HubP family polar landmark protein [Gammaproteobacteria bacterium]|nr:FimV/HubP family polar landmark protein [Gammaproteobacteria bacterium]